MTKTKENRDFAYNKIIERLKINEKFLEEHKDIIKQRCEAAGTEILMGLKSNLENADITGINKCLQLASTILLLGTQSDNITEELNCVARENTNERINDIDPSTILTIAVLYHLINLKEKELIQIRKRTGGSEEKNICEDESSLIKIDTINAIRERFSKIKWLVGTNWMKKLGIK